MGDMGMWGLSSYSPYPAPVPITSKPLPLITLPRYAGLAQSNSLPIWQFLTPA